MKAAMVLTGKVGGARSLQYHHCIRVAYMYSLVRVKVGGARHVRGVEGALGLLQMEVYTCLLVLFTFMPRIRGATDIIPERFPTRDLADYTVRYLSECGNDTESCLSGQLYPPSPQDGDSQHCRSLIFALTGGGSFQSRDKSNVIVLILPGSYPMGERGIEIFDYRNIILSKMPGTVGEVVVKCSRMHEDNYNNFFIVRALNFALTGIVFTECGSYSTPVRLEESSNAVITNCTFR